MTSSWSSRALVGLSILVSSGCGASAPASGVAAMDTVAATSPRLSRITRPSVDALNQVLPTLGPLTHGDALARMLARLPAANRLVDANGPTVLFDELLTLEETLRVAGVHLATTDLAQLRLRAEEIPAPSRYDSPLARHNRLLALLQLEALGWHAALDIAFELGGALVDKVFVSQLPRDFNRFGRAVFEALVPDDADYTALLTAHLNLQGLVVALDGPETQLPVDKDWYPTLFGTKKPRILLLRKRLSELGYFAPPVSEMRSFDSSMERQLRAFQTHHGLEPTGRPNAESARALNVPLRHRIWEVSQALRQRRLDPLRNLPERLVLNLPSFELQHFSAGKCVGNYDVVVGSNEADIDPFRQKRGPINRTPQLVTTVTQIVLNPSWVVPRRIKELVLDPLADHDPRRYDDFQLFVGSDGVEQAVQLPGPKNALGQVKFVLAGTHLIMHGTPGRRPFKLRKRALSHGNVRVQHAPKLAKHLLTNDGNAITPKRLDSVLRKRLETFVTLRTPVPISIYYATVDVGSDGEVRFHPDVYEAHTEMKGQGRGAEVARRLAP